MIGADLKLARLEIHSKVMHCAHQREALVLISAIVLLSGVKLPRQKSKWPHVPVGLTLKKDKSDRCLRRVSLKCERLVEPRV